MNKAIKYIICTGASLVIGFGAGYLFKGAEDNMPMQKQARFEANAIQNTSENYKKITGDLYDAQKAASDLDKSLDRLRKTINGMGGNYRGSPGRPGDSGVGNLFPVEGSAGSSKAGGLEDLFKGPGPKKESDSDNEKKSDEDTQRRLEESYERFDRTNKKIQEDIKSAHEYVRQIRENARIGMKALENGMEALRSGGGGLPNLPDVPVIPDLPEDKQEEKKK